MTTRTRVTKRQAEKALTAIKRQWKVYLEAGYEPPTLIMDFDWSGHGPSPAIVWEEGPYEWALFANFGGGKDEYGFDVAPADYDHDEVFVEPITSWALGIYPPS